jgi:hypothetical protein
LLCVACTEVDVELGSSTHQVNKEQITSRKLFLFVSLVNAACRTIDIDQNKDTDESTQDSCSKLVSNHPTKKNRVKNSKKRNKKTSLISEVDSCASDKVTYCNQLENKLKWAVDEVNV